MKCWSGSPFRFGVEHYVFVIYWDMNLVVELRSLFSIVDETTPLAMSKIERFEDLKCWQAARVLVKESFGAASEGALSRDFDTRSQFKRAALSSMNNISEGFGRFSDKEFIRFLDTAQSSVQEVESMLYVFEDLAYLPEERISSLRSKATNTKSLILGLIKYLRNK